MDGKINSAIKLIIEFAKQNPEFGQGLKSELNNLYSLNTIQTINSISSDVTAIRKALNIQANCSISYDFIPNQRLRDQLIIDNLRMENAAIGLKESEKERFYTFCVNAFYQVENIVNYYYYVLYPSIDDLLKAIEEGTRNETKNEQKDYRFHRNSREKSVPDIPIAHKLNAFCNTNFPEDNIKITLSQLRQVRNEGEHRCMVIQEGDKNNSLYKFFRYNSFNTIRQVLIKLVNAVKLATGKS